MKKALLLFAALLVAGCGEKAISEFSLPLSDANIEQIIKEAVSNDSLQERGGLLYVKNKSKPYSGWVANRDRDRAKHSEFKEALGMGDVTLYKEGVRHGPSTTWWGDVKISEGTYKEGKQEGVWTERTGFNFGPPLQKATYKDGERHGLSTAWHENGQKQGEATYKDGELDGLWTEWQPNGLKMAEETYKDGERHGPHSSWYDTGQKRSEKTYKDGKLDGLWTEWRVNGQKYREKTYKDGEEDGLKTQWYVNGQKWKEETYKDGKLDGPATSWHNNSAQMSSELLYQDGERHGPYTSWYNTGQKRSEGVYKVGKRNGVYTRWHPNGQKWVERTHKDGELLAAKYWNSKGEEVETEEEAKK
jgi:antitoxin component YwqK of YwqJK toxin-antitoxin module